MINYSLINRSRQVLSCSISTHENWEYTGCVNIAIRFIHYDGDGDFWIFTIAENLKRAMDVIGSYLDKPAEWKRESSDEFTITPFTITPGKLIIGNGDSV